MVNKFAKFFEETGVSKMRLSDVLGVSRLTLDKRLEDGEWTIVQAIKIKHFFRMSEEEFNAIFLSDL